MVANRTLVSGLSMRWRSPALLDCPANAKIDPQKHWNRAISGGLMAVDEWMNGLMSGDHPHGVKLMEPQGVSVWVIINSRHDKSK